MNLTAYHSKYFAYELTKRCPSDSVEKLAGALMDAQVDLNPHQVDAALFAFQSPLSQGAILADEVGLGKTIEAGLVISQKWAERRRKILVITPANLRKQWYQELTEKFALPCRILESKTYTVQIKRGDFRPFEGDGVVLVSYQFAKSRAAELSATSWDLVVMDEAHRLRNVYKSSNVTANILKAALARFPKILLTATPLQNSLQELFGLVSIVDDRVFGSLQSFQDQFSNLEDEKVFDVLKSRLSQVCHRTLRRQVVNVKFTRRNSMLEKFTPEEAEDRLYSLVTEYLSRENLQALPSGQRQLITLILRKLLASSTFAIAGALESMAARLREKVAGAGGASLEEDLEKDYEALDETAEEWPEVAEPPLSEADRSAIQTEIKDLEEFAALACSIQHNAKGRALIKALRKAFEELRKIEAPEKAIIFTESRRTQNYIQRLLVDEGLSEGLVLFNGSNSDEGSRAIYAEWLARHQGTDRITGSKTADMRSALVDYFREKGRIMIATEAGAEGINLQFCALVVNYDLPWNPQRIEQRIGRCHRYGQKNDVVVVNFLNEKNEADRRVFELLEDKFHLFKGVFGSSDEVLGAIESGVDLERRIADIYQRCRTSDAIAAAFNQLQQELQQEISEGMAGARRKLMENFDEVVLDRLRVMGGTSADCQSAFERWLMLATCFELGSNAEFLNEGAFRLNSNPFGESIPTGLYELPRRSGEAHLYRLSHPLAEAVLSQAKGRPLEAAEVEFDLSGHTGRVSALEPFKGSAGHIRFSVLAVDAPDHGEDHLVLSMIGDDGRFVDEETARQLFRLSGQIKPARAAIPSDITGRLSEHADGRMQTIRDAISKRYAAVLDTEAEKLDGWADDMKIGLERELKDLDRQIKEARKAAKLAVMLDEKLAFQKKQKMLEATRSTKRKMIYAEQDELDRKRDELIHTIEGRLAVNPKTERLFEIRWRIV